MDTNQRYQVYLNPVSVSILDEAGDLVGVARSRFLREAAEAAADRLGNLLAMVKPISNSSYDWIDQLCGSVSVKNVKNSNFSERVDDLYYGK